MNNQPVTQAEKNRQKLKEKRENQLLKKELQLNKMTDEEVIAELKTKNIPTFGTKPERLERLKKAHGITPTSGLGDGKQGVAQSNDLGDDPSSNKNNGGGAGKKNAPKDKVVEKIEKMQKEREERRQKMEDLKREKAERAAENEANGRLVDVEFDLMVDKYRFKQPLLQPHTPSSEIKLCICVRKRPIFKKEQQSGEIDAVSCANPQIVVHECKYKVDGITKYVDNQSFTFDNTFNQMETNQDIYKSSLLPHIDFLLNQGIVTCFAYGQTGSGKTFTMRGMQESVISDLFRAAGTKYKNQNLQFYCSFFEIYGGRCYDLLNKQNKLAILEDKNQNVQIQGLEERAARSPEEMIGIIDYGNSIRTTHQTVANDTSSRSHAICQIIVKDQNERQQGKLLLVDLAGSERAQDTQSNNRARRIEGAEINKSLLALKECIRAMDSNKGGSSNHVPFRASKLTLVLRDSFTSKNGKTRIVMIACVSPGSSSADHSLNTLRYADRLKDRSNLPPIKPMKYSPEDYNEEQKQEESKPVSQNQVNSNNIKNVSRQNSEVEKKGNQKSSRNEIENDNDKANLQPSRNDSSASNQSNSSKNKKAGGIPPKNSNPTSASNLNKGKGAGAGQKKGKGLSIDNLPEREAADNNDSSPDERDTDDSPTNAKKPNADLKYMKETMRMDKKNVSHEFFDFQEKVDTILEEQEEIFATHMSAIKEDARLLTHESELISNVQGVGVVDYDIDSYVQKLEAIIKTKLQIYGILDKRLGKFKKHLKEEEEISSKIKETFYY